jgi:hypothetical protein
VLIRGLAAADESGYKHPTTYNGTYGTTPWGHTSLVLDGTNDVVSVTETIGNLTTVAFHVKPTTDTEQLIRIATGKTITVSGGTITYTGVTAAATYVDCAASTTLVAGAWQHVVCVLSAAHEGAQFAAGYDGAAYGEGQMANIRAYAYAMTLDEACALRSYCER